MLHAPDLRAFERTYRAEGPFVAAVLGRLAVPSEAVYDAVQDVFVAAYRRWPDYDATRPVRPWLTAFAHRVAFRYRRSQARRDRKRAALRHVQVQRSQTEHLHARAFLERFLGGLSEGHRRVFVLSELEGCTAPEVAEALGISTEAVYGRVRSVRRKLHRALMEDAREPGARAASLVPPWSLVLPQLGAGVGVLSMTGIKLVAASVLLGAGVVTVAAVTLGDGGAPPVAQPTVRAEAGPTATPSQPRPATSTVASVAPPAPEPVLTPSRTSHEPRVPRALPSEPVSSLQLESALLRAAKQAQAQGRLEEALAKLDAHARRFPDGQLADGRRRARIRVLCDLGRTAQARGEAKLLAQQSPADPLALQALEICTPAIQKPAEAEKRSMKP